MPLRALTSMSLQEAGGEHRITVKYRPRAYFLPFHGRSERFACIVAHRRAGKTVACIHELLKRALTTDRDATKWAYVAPTYAQAKSTAWDYLVEAVAPLMPYGVKINQTDLSVKLPNGSEIRLFGADNYNTLRGLRLDGAVLDEYADFDPRAWTAVIRPALSDRRGFAVFIGTPRGHNHFYDIYSRAVKDPEWFTASLRSSDLVPTNDLDPDAELKDLLTTDELDAARRQMSEEEFNQEYECDFESANPGAYYGKQMAAAQKEGRISTFPWDSSRQVYTAWDIGGDRDATAIWFAQLQGTAVYLVDYFEATGADSAPYAKHLLSKPYSYAQHFLPHDAGPDRIGVDQNYSDFLRNHGLRNITVLPSPGKREHGINLVRLLLPRCSFDGRNCEYGVEALRMYQTEQDIKNSLPNRPVFKSSPKHDWASHGADAFRYLAVGLDKHVSSPSFNRKLHYPKGY